MTNHYLKNLRRSSAFTIVELLIVIVVIAILAAITIVSYTGVSARAKDVALKSEVNQVSKIIQMNQTVNAGLPAADNAVTTRVDVLTNTGLTAFRDKLCIRYWYYDNSLREYYDTCNPSLVEGQVPQYDKNKIYLSYDRYPDSYFTNVSGVFIELAYSYWSNAQNSWITTSIFRSTGGYSSDTTEQAGNGDKADISCDPFGGTSQQYYNDDCQYRHNDL